MSYTNRIIDNEIIGMVRRTLRGFPVDEDTLCVDEIQNVGIEGSFLATDHTLTHFRTSLYMPKLLVREQRASAGHSAYLVARAENEVEQLLNGPREPMLDEYTERELLRIEKMYSIHVV